MGPEMSSEKELMAQFSTATIHKRPKKLVNDDTKQRNDRDKNINISRNYNPAKERTKQASIQQVESEAQNLGEEGTNNGTEDLGEGFKSNRNEKFNDPCFKVYKKGSFNIHLQVKRPDTQFVEGKKEKKWGQLDIFNVMAKYKFSFQSTR
jgi:hypothetical protein